MSKISEIGGHMLSCYGRLQNIVYRLNNKNVPFLELMGMADSIKSIIDYSQMSRDELKNAFCESMLLPMVEETMNDNYYFSDCPLESKKEPLKKSIIKISEKNKDLSKKEIVYLALKKIKNRATDEAFKKIERDCFAMYHEIWCTTYWADVPIINTFSSALVLDDGYITIDEKVFLKIYNEIASIKRTEIYQKHKKCVDEINNFFNGVPINEEELKKYFKIQHGIIKINDNISEDLYARLL